MHAAVDHESGEVDAQPGGIVDDVAVLVDLHQRRGGDLLEHESIGIDQQVLGSGHPRREMRVDQVGPLEQRSELVGGRKIAAHFPLFLADALVDR